MLEPEHPCFYCWSWVKRLNRRKSLVGSIYGYAYQPPLFSSSIIVLQPSTGGADGEHQWC